MFNKLVRWFWAFIYRRQVQQLLTRYQEVSQSRDRTLFIGSFFTQQETLLNSRAFDSIFLNALPSSSVYIYYDLNETIKKFGEFARTLESNGMINGNTLGEFQTNAEPKSIHLVFNQDEEIKTQLQKLVVLLRRMLVAYEKQTPTMKAANLSRIIVPFEMFSILLDRLAKSYIDMN